MNYTLVREINVVLGTAAFFLLCWRTPPILSRLSSKRLFFSLVAFPTLVVFATVQALAKHAPTGPVVPLFTVAYLALIVVLVWLPRSLR